MATAIDGELLLGSVTLPGIVNATLQPSDAAIGIVRIEDSTKTNIANVFSDGTLSVTGEAAGGTTVPSSIAVGIVATKIVSVQAGRRLFSVTNPETTDPLNILYIGDASITVGSGIPLFPGETYEETEATGEWWGIFAVTGKTVPFLTIVRP